MTHVVTDRCVDCRYTDCCTVCPVDCFYEIESPAMLVIDPDTCIDCALCVPECPINAIWPEDELPDVYQEWVEKNAELFSSGTQITTKKDPLPGALTLEQILAKEKERGWDVREPSGAKGGGGEAAPAAEEEAGEEEPAEEEAVEEEAAEEKAPAKTATAKGPRKLEYVHDIEVPDGLNESQAKVFKATANTIYKWRTVRSLARHVQLPQGTVEGDLEKLVNLGHVTKRPPEDSGVVVYGAKARVEA